MITGNSILLGGGAASSSSGDYTGVNDSVWTLLAKRNFNSFSDTAAYVRSIRPYAFYSCGNLRSVFFPAVSILYSLM